MTASSVIDRELERRISASVRPLVDRIMALEGQLAEMRRPEPYRDDEEITTAQAGEYLGLGTSNGTLHRLREYGLTPSSGAGRGEKKRWLFGPIRLKQHRYSAPVAAAAKDSR